MNALGLAILGCAVCFGDPESPLTKGAQAGVLLLLGVIVFVQLAIVGVIIFWVQRAKMLEANEEYERRKPQAEPTRARA